MHTATICLAFSVEITCTAGLLRNVSLKVYFGSTSHKSLLNSFSELDGKKLRISSRDTLLHSVLSMKNLLLKALGLKNLGNCID